MLVHEPWVKKRPIVTSYKEIQIRFAELKWVKNGKSKSITNNISIKNVIFSNRPGIRILDTITTVYKYRLCWHWCIMPLHLMTLPYEYMYVPQEPFGTASFGKCLSIYNWFVLVILIKLNSFASRLKFSHLLIFYLWCKAIIEFCCILNLFSSIYR